MRWFIAYHNEAIKDLKKLDGSQRLQVAKAIEKVSKNPVSIHKGGYGKPNAEIIESIVAKYGFKKEDMVMVGDRLYTDIKTGSNAGIASVLVYSGETKEADYQISEIRADFVFDSVNDMKEWI